jgi:hypothetical protein
LEQKENKLYRAQQVASPHSPKPTGQERKEKKNSTSGKAIQIPDPFYPNSKLIWEDIN